MEVIIIESEAFKKLQSDLIELAQVKEIEDTWLSSAQVQKILGVSQKTWQTYRDKRIIKFSQIGSKIYVRASWLEEFLENHKVEIED